MRRFLRLFEDSWDCKLHTHLFPDAIGEDAFALLCREGVLEPAGQAETYPCPGSGGSCPRVVVPVPRNKATPFLAVCGDRRGCVSVPLTEEQTHVHALNRRAWVALLRSAYALDGPISYDVPGAFGLWSIGQARGRDVLLAEKPDGHDLLEIVLAREGLPRRTRVLVPTATRVDDFLVHRCRPGEHVELVILEDELAIEDGALVVVSGATVAADPEPPRVTRPRAFALPPGASWRDLRVYRVDGHTVSVRGAGVHRRLTYIDLGMASEKSREPTKAWELLMALCEGGGTLRWRGDATAVKRQVSTLRAQLKASFGLDDDPFAPYAKGGWRSQFAAYPSADDAGEISPAPPDGW